MVIGLDDCYNFASDTLDLSHLGQGSKVKMWIFVLVVDFMTKLAQNVSPLTVFNRGRWCYGIWMTNSGCLWGVLSILVGPPGRCSGPLNFDPLERIFQHLGIFQSICSGTYIPAPIDMKFFMHILEVICHRGGAICFTLAPTVSGWQPFENDYSSPISASQLNFKSL